MGRLPADRLEAERFYRTLKAVSIASSNGVDDPWGVIPWEIDARHAEIIAKLEVGDPAQRDEVEEYLRECLRLATDFEGGVTAKIIPFRARVSQK